MFVWCRSFRSFHSGLRRFVPVDKASLSKLRKKTGFSFSHCKNALEQFNNDLEQAETWLRQQAQKEGWARATKLQGRPMSQGLISVLRDGSRATMIEVNCETDFVAKNSKFHDLVAKLTTACHESFEKASENKVELSKDAMSRIVSSDGKSIGDLVAMEIGNIGENILARRVVRLASSADATLDTYVHLAGPPLLAINGCIMGKYGALLTSREVKCDLTPELPLAESNQLICQHIVGMNPKLIGEPEEQVTNEEPCNKESESSQVEGEDELKSDERSREEENRLIFQEYLLDPKITMLDFLKKNYVEVLDFVRYECGEDLPEN